MNEGILKNSELRGMARGLLLGKYGRIIFIHICFVLITAYMNELTFRTQPNASVVRLLLYIVLSIIVSLLAGVFRFGLTRCYMNLCCGIDYSFADLFYGFKHDSVRILKLSALLAIIETVCYIPASYFLSAYNSDRQALSFFFACLAITLGTIVYVSIMLRLAFAYYLLLDFPDKSFSEIIKMSVYLMKGNGLRLIYLYAGFIPVFSLGVLSAGIGLLWLVPYAEATLTCFYLNRVSNA
ncbi:MAG: DUF975 family protein [Lachnospiraceae bacterium]|nr:DUF975 family protein [Lachnospiraceae bacterium]